MFSEFWSLDHLPTTETVILFDKKLWFGEERKTFLAFFAVFRPRESPFLTQFLKTFLRISSTVASTLFFQVGFPRSELGVFLTFAG